jgi:hypothetical protein
MVPIFDFMIKLLDRTNNKMENRAFVSNNVDYEKMSQNSIFRDVYVPNNSTDFLTNNKKYLEQIYTEKVPVLKKKDFPSEIKFDIKTKLKPAIVFAALLDDATKNGRSTANVCTKWGFDIKSLPDINYLLRVLYSVSPNHAIIRALPRVETNTDEKLAKFRAIEAQVALDTIDSKGKSVKKNDEFDLNSCLPEIKRLNSIAVTYDILKFQMAKLKDNFKECIKFAGEDETAKQIMVEMRSSNAFKINELGLDPKEKKILKEIGEQRTAIKSGEGMEMESEYEADDENYQEKQADNNQRGKGQNGTRKRVGPFN